MQNGYDPAEYHKKVKRCSHLCQLLQVRKFFQNIWPFVLTLLTDTREATDETSAAHRVYTKIAERGPMSSEVMDLEDKYYIQRVEIGQSVSMMKILNDIVCFISTSAKENKCLVKLGVIRILKNYFAKVQESLTAQVAFSAMVISTH